MFIGANVEAPIQSPKSPFALCQAKSGQTLVWSWQMVVSLSLGLGLQLLPNSLHAPDLPQLPFKSWSCTPFLDWTAFKSSWLTEKDTLSNKACVRSLSVGPCASFKRYHISYWRSPRIFQTCVRRPRDCSIKLFQANLNSNCWLCNYNKPVSMHHRWVSCCID